MEIHRVATALNGSKTYDLLFVLESLLSKCKCVTMQNRNERNRNNKEKETHNQCLTANEMETTGNKIQRDICVVGLHFVGSAEA